MNEVINNFQAAELMLRASRGDKEAFGLIYGAYFSHIYRYIYFRVQSQVVAEDITQAVFLRVFEKIPDYQARSSPPLAYLFTVARNKVIDHWRKNKSIGSVTVENNLEGVSTPETTEKIVDRAVAAREIGQALEKIPSDQRDVVILKYLDQLSYAEIAQLVKKKETAIRQLASRGLKSLRRYFQGKDFYE